MPKERALRMSANCPRRPDEGIDLMHEWRRGLSFSASTYRWGSAAHLSGGHPTTRSTRRAPHDPGLRWLLPREFGSSRGIARCVRGLPRRPPSRCRAGRVEDFRLTRHARRLRAGRYRKPIVCQSLQREPVVRLPLSNLPWVQSARGGRRSAPDEL